MINFEKNHCKKGLAVTNQIKKKVFQPSKLSKLRSNEPNSDRLHLLKFHYLCKQNKI